MGEIWIPLVQNPLEGSVLYSDFRFMDDNLDNQEYNIGFGYRTIKNNIPIVGRGIMGVHGWMDRRHTNRGTHFNQATLGGEIFTETIDAKINVYAPLNKQKTHLDPNPNGINPQFTGNVLTVNTDQVVVEEAMPGFDVEFGARVPWMDAYTDSTRFYAGAYHFEGRRAENVTGFRTRLSADITSDIQFGGRFQHDDVRGGQGFLEMTIRLPFGRKQSYRKTGLYARLDESPERDIDIVSNEAITDSGFNKPVVNATTNSAQNVIHVDNTAAGGGDGSNEARFNTLAAAQAAAGANDLIYVHHGDGTTTGQNAGITLAHEGMKLVGSGVDLTPELMGFSLPSNARGLNAQTPIIAATTAPVITNTGGDAITIGANTIKVSGLTINGSTDDGIEISGQDNVTISNMTIQNTTDKGIQITNAKDLILNDITTIATGSTAIHGIYEDNDTYNLNWSNLTLSNNVASSQLYLQIDNATNVTFNGSSITSNGSASTAIHIQTNNDANLNATMRNISIDNSAGSLASAFNMETNDSSSAIYTVHDSYVDSKNTASASMRFSANNNSQLQVNIYNSTLKNGRSDNIDLQSRGNASVSNVNIVGNIIDTTTEWHGIKLRATNNGNLDGAYIANNTVLNSNGSGIIIDDHNGTTSSLSNITILNNTVSNSNQYGITVFSTASTGDIENVTIDGNTSHSNTRHGIYVRASTGEITSVKIQNNTVYGNTQYGLYIDDDFAGGMITADVGGGFLGSIGNNRIYNNTVADIVVDLDGDELKAENNWWGVPTGLDPSRVLLDGGSAIDADPFLTSAP